MTTRLHATTIQAWFDAEPPPLDPPGGPDVIATLLTAQIIAEEAEVRRLLPLWPMEAGQPGLAYSRGGVLLGLCAADAPLGEVCRVLVPVGACKNDPTPL